MASKVAFDPEEPSLGRIRAESIAPPHSPSSIKRCISRLERNPALAWHTDLFADLSCDTPLKEGHIPIHRTDGPGLSPNDPMAIVQRPLIFSDGRYVIKNRAVNIFWNVWLNPMKAVHFFSTTVDSAKANNFNQVNNHSPII